MDGTELISWTNVEYHKLSDEISVLELAEKIDRQVYEMRLMLRKEETTPQEVTRTLARIRACTRKIHQHSTK